MSRKMRGLTQDPYRPSINVVAQSRAQKCAVDIMWEPAAKITEAYVRVCHQLVNSGTTDSNGMMEVRLL
jgi:hypothetical protein